MWEHFKVLWGSSRAFQAALIAGAVGLLLILAAQPQNTAGPPSLQGPVAGSPVGAVMGTVQQATGMSTTVPQQARGTLGKACTVAGKAVDVADTVVDVSGRVVNAGAKALDPILSGGKSAPTTQPPPATPGKP